MAHSKTVVVVGAGAAGVQTAAALREAGWQGQVMLLCAEPGIPYQRPPLSKAFLVDAAPTLQPLRPAAFYPDQGIDLRPETRVAAIDRAASRVRTSGGEEVAFDHLVLATGARNRIPPITGLSGENPATLRMLQDARSLRDTLRTARSLVIIGGGVIGLEVAASARAFGREVTVVEALPSVLRRMASPATAHHLELAHRGMGTAFVLGAPVTSVKSSSGEVRVETAAGSVVEGDALLVAAGVAAETTLAESAGLAVDDGVVVDATLRTTDPRIFAIGDCARFPSPFAGGALVRLESVQNALDQARHVARAITGGSSPYVDVPWFWSDQGPKKLQVVGLAPEHDDEVVLGEPDSGRFTRLLFRQGRLAAGESVNRPLDHISLRRMLASGTDLTSQMARRHGFDLREHASTS